MSRARGLWREAPILLPASLLLFALLAVVTLLSYRAAVARFAEEREQATLKLAVALADAMRLAKSDDIALLARWLPPGAAMATYDARGVASGSFGFTGDDALPMPPSVSAALAAPRLDPLGRGAAGEAATVRAFVPFHRGAQRLLLRLEVPEPALVAQRRSLGILTPVVVGLAAAAALLAIFFLRALMRPYEELLERVRAAVPADALPTAGGSDARAGDDVEALLATFDRALATLRSDGGHGGRSLPGGLEPGAALDDLSAVERALGPQLESGLLMFDRAGALLAANPAAV